MKWRAINHSATLRLSNFTSIGVSLCLLVILFYTCLMLLHFDRLVAKWCTCYRNFIFKINANEVYDTFIFFMKFIWQMKNVSFSKQVHISTAKIWPFLQRDSNKPKFIKLEYFLTEGKVIHNNKMKKSNYSLKILAVQIFIKCCTSIKIAYNKNEWNTNEGNNKKNNFLTFNSDLDV